MIRVDCRLHLSGSKFSPDEVETKFDIELSDKEEVGSLGEFGRYRNKPLPSGSAVYHISNNLTDLDDDEIRRIDTLIAALPGFRESGIEEPVIHIDVAWQNQCNMEFSADFIGKLAQLNLPITISCYEDQLHE